MKGMPSQHSITLAPAEHDQEGLGEGVHRSGKTTR
jgi:hypothetical protein